MNVRTPDRAPSSVPGTRLPSGSDPPPALVLERFDRSLKAEEVTRFDRSLGAAIERMLDLMRRERYVALSGPIVGLPLRIVAVDLAGSGQSQIVLINPVIEQVSIERQKDREGCLLSPHVFAQVERPVSMVVRALSRTGQPVRLQVGGILARILQHHIDHLDGRAFAGHAGPPILHGLGPADAARQIRKRGDHGLLGESPSTAFDETGRTWE